LVGNLLSFSKGRLEKATLVVGKWTSQTCRVASRPFFPHEKVISLMKKLSYENSKVTLPETNTKSP